MVDYALDAPRCIIAIERDKPTERFRVAERASARRQRSTAPRTA